MGGGRDIQMGVSVRQREERERITPEQISIIIPVANVTNSNTTLYTVRADHFFYIQDFGVCNISDTGIAINIHIVPVGGSATDLNKVYDGYVVETNDSGTLTAILGTTLNPEDFIVASTDNAIGANFWINGIETSGGLATT